MHEIVSQSEKRRARMVMCALLFACGLLLIVLFLFFTKERISPTFFIATDSVAQSGAPITLYNAETGEMKKLEFLGGGCDGVSLNRKTKQIYLSCRVGKDTFPVYNPVRGSVSTSTIQMLQQQTFRSPLSCHSFGKCFYGFGYIDASDDARGRIVVVENGLPIKTIFVPHADSHLIPVRMKIVDDVLYVLLRGPTGSPGSIAMYNIKKEDFEQTTIMLPVDAWDFAVDDKHIAVTVFRDESGVDVMIFDKGGKLQNTIQLNGGKKNSFNVFGVYIENGSLFVSGFSGVSKYNLKNLEKTFEWKTDNFLYELAGGGGDLIVVSPVDNFVYVFDQKDLSIKKKLPIYAGSGSVFYIESYFVHGLFLRIAGFHIF